MKKFHLFDLPKEIRIELNKNYHNKIFSLACKKVGSYYKLAKLIDVSSKEFYNWKNRKYPLPIFVLEKIASLLQISQSEIELKVKALKFYKGTIKNPKLPIRLDENLSLILAGILGDGGISKEYRVYYCNSKNILINSFINSVRKSLGKVKITQDITEKGIRTIFFSKLFGRILVELFSLPTGDKTYKDYSVPSLIFSSKNSIISTFLQRLFDDEGSVHRTARNIRISTTIESDKLLDDKGPKRLFEIKELLNKFSIRSSEPNKTGEDFHKSFNGKLAKVEHWELGIYDRKSLENFAENIGFKLSYKRKSLITAINSFKRYAAPKGKCLDVFLEESLKLLEENKRPFTSKELSKKMGKSLEWSNHNLKILKERKLIKQIENEWPPNYTIK